MVTPIPTNINTAFQRGSFTETPVDDVLRTPMGGGPMKTRPRTTRVRYKLTGLIYLTKAQYISWRAFFDVTLVAGSQPLKFTHPITEEEGDYNISKPPVVKDMGPNSYALTIELQGV